MLLEESPWKALTIFSWQRSTHFSHDPSKVSVSPSAVSSTLPLPFLPKILQQSWNLSKVSFTKSPGLQVYVQVSTLQVFPNCSPEGLWMFIWLLMVLQPVPRSVYPLPDAQVNETSPRSLGVWFRVPYSHRGTFVHAWIPNSLLKGETKKRKSYTTMMLTLPHDSQLHI